jgi:hypothetical protein
MKYMQRGYLKFVATILFAIFFVKSHAQVTSHRLKTADSLFAAKLYTQSLEHYEEILKQKEYSPSMLLKMAFIHEGLNHIGQALYYLNLYYIATKDKTVQEKIQELATKYNLDGYDVSDSDQMLAFYHDNRLFISLGLAAFMILFLSTGYFGKKRGIRPIASFALMIIFGAAFFAHLFYGEEVKTGIVAAPSTYLMNGPSAGASVVEIIGDGHRVEVIGRKDVWLRVRWNNQEAFVKETAVLPIEL